MEAVIGIDPGTEKFGIAVVTSDGECVWRSVEATERLAEVVEEVARKYPCVKLVLGDGTGSRAFQARMEKEGATKKLGTPVVVDERHSTEEASRLYLKQNRRGWRRFVPLGLQTPDIPVDGYVAEVLARRYLAAQGGANRS